MINSFKLTKKGQNYIARSLSDRALVFTRAQYGSGVPADGVDPFTMTGLVKPLGQLHISNVISEAGTTTITTQFSNRVNGQILSAFHMTEVGIWGKLQSYDGSDDLENTEALLCYGYVPENQADYIDAVLTEFIINFPIKISGEAVVEVTIDESLVYPTIAEMNEAVQQLYVTVTSTEEQGRHLMGKIDKSFTEIKKAYEDNKSIFLVYGGIVLPLVSINSDPNEPGAEFGTTINGMGLFVSTNDGDDVMIVASWYPDSNAFTQHTSSKSNPHGVTKAQVGLGNVDNTSDKDKPVSTEQAKAIANASKKMEAILSTGTGEAYEVTIDGVTKLTKGLTFVMKPHTPSTTTSPTLNVNGLGAKTINMSVLGETFTGISEAKEADWLKSDEPVILMYNGLYWVSVAPYVKNEHHADNLKGVVSVEKGGTGAIELVKGSYLVGNGKNPITQKVAAEVYADIKGNIQADFYTKTQAQAKIADSGWKTLTLAGGVTAKDTGGFAVPKYRKYGDHVIIQGGVTVAASQSPVTIGTLPSDFRPASTVHKMAPCGGQRIARIYVAPSGEIVLEWMMNIKDGTLEETSQWLTLNIDFYN